MSSMAARLSGAEDRAELQAPTRSARATHAAQRPMRAGSRIMLGPFAQRDEHCLPHVDRTFGIVWRRYPGVYSWSMSDPKEQSTGGYSGSRELRHLVRAAGNIRIILLGLPGPRGAKRATRPIATGTFSFPALSTN